MKLCDSQPVSVKRMVILGSKGFVGSCLVEELKKRQVPYLGLSSQDCNLMEPESVNKLCETLEDDDTVVFISALTPDKGRDLKTVQKNLSMMEHFTQVLKHRKLRQIIYLSSDAVYGDVPGVISETSACHPNTFHGAMHLVREIALQEFTKVENIPLCILRPTAIFGNGDTHGSYGPNRFFKSAQMEAQIKLFGAGAEKRDHVFIGDVVQVICLVAEHKAVGTLNLVNGVAVSFLEIAQQIDTIVGSIKIETSEQKNPIIHKHFDNRLLIESFPGFQPTRVDQGLIKMTSKQ